EPAVGCPPVFRLHKQEAWRVPMTQSARRPRRLFRCRRRCAVPEPRAACGKPERRRKIPRARSGEESMKHVDPRMASALAPLALLGACVMPPTMPTIPVAPGLNKTFEAFAAEQAYCQQYATAQTAPQAYAATNQAVGTAILTAALGAAL